MNALENIAVRHKGDALAPRAIARRKVLLHGLFRQEGANAGEQLFAHHIRFLHGPARKLALIEQDLAASNLVDPLLLDLKLAQIVDQVIAIAARDEIGR